MINDETPLETLVYSGLGSYPYPFKCYDASELAVTHISATGVSTILVYNVDYTVNLTTPSYQGGSVVVVLASLPASGFLEIKSNITFDQDVDLAVAGPLNLTKFQTTEDRLVMRLQLLRLMLEMEYTAKTYRGDWVTTTGYNAGDLVIGPSERDLYAAKSSHTSGAFATDLAAGKWDAVITEAEVLTAAGLPGISTGDALKVVRVNSLETGYELAHMVPKPTTSIKGMVPVVNVDGDDYEALSAFKDPSPRARFYWVSSTQIRIDGYAAYHVKDFGPVEITSNLTITPTITSTSYWHYFYIKAVPSARILVAADIIDQSTAPTYAEDHNGWYDASGNLCIFATYIDGSGAITGFTHYGGREVWWDNGITIRAYAALGSGWQTVNARAPEGCEEVVLWFLLSDPTANAIYHYRPSGSTAGVGQTIGNTLAATSRYCCTTRACVFLDYVRAIELVSDVTTSYARVDENAWLLPKGM